MKKLISILIAVFLISNLFAQEADLSKKIFYLDGVAELNLEHCKYPKAEGQTCVVKSAKTGESLFSTYIYNAGSGGFMVDISFLDFELELRTGDMLLKKIFTEMYAMKVIDEEGKVNQANAEKFARAYDIVKNRTIIIVD